jgi:hypothetical protein
MAWRRDSRGGPMRVLFVLCSRPLGLRSGTGCCIGKASRRWTVEEEQRGRRVDATHIWLFGSWCAGRGVSQQVE